MNTPSEHGENNQQAARELPVPAIPADCDGECIHGPYFTTEQMFEFAKRPVLSDVELKALDGVLSNVEHDAGDVDDLAPRIEDDEDAYWAWHAYHGLKKLINDLPAPPRPTQESEL